MKFIVAIFGLTDLVTVVFQIYRGTTPLEVPGAPPGRKMGTRK